MSNRMSLVGKLKGNRAQSQSLERAYRFNPNAEDLEELPIETTKVPGKLNKSNDKPKQNLEAELTKEKKGVEKFETDLSRDKTSGSTDQESDGFSPSPSSETKGINNGQDDVRETLPYSRGKKSIQSDDNNKSLFSDLKGRLAKSLDERNAKDGKAIPETGAIRRQTAFDAEENSGTDAKMLKDISQSSVEEAVECSENILESSQKYSSLKGRDSKRASMPITFSSLKSQNSEEDIVKTNDSWVVINKEDIPVDKDEAKSVDAEKADLLRDPIVSPAGKPQTCSHYIICFVTRLMNNLHLELSLRNICLAIVVVFIALFFGPVGLPFPIFTFICGVICTIVITKLYNWFVPSDVPRKYIPIPDYASLPPLKVTAAVPVVTDSSAGRMVWMNEYPLEYNPDTYHLNATHSVFVRLDGTSLRLRRPRVNVPRRAMWDEPNHEPHFISDRHFDLTGAKIELLPADLSSKRLWSKKYPICLNIPHSKSAKLNLNSMKLDNSVELPSPVSTPGEEFPGSFPKSSNIVTIYLFTRTSREKEEWYYLFKKAVKPEILASTRSIADFSITASKSPQKPGHKRSSSFDLGDLSITTEEAEEVPDSETSTVKSKIDYEKYMQGVLGSAKRSASPALANKKKKIKDRKQLSSETEYEFPPDCNNIRWFNALAGRVLYDFLNMPEWNAFIFNKIQKKLEKIRVPYFIETITITNIDFGTDIPKFHRSSEPYFDERGTWILLDVTYQGALQMTLNTKLNLMKLKKSGTYELPDVITSEHTQRHFRMDRGSDTESEDSAESSDDGATPDVENGEINESSTPGKTVLKWVDKVTHTRVFQSVVENKYVKRKMENISNTPLSLTVEINSFIGTLALNIPPPPSDRIWVGFTEKPELTVNARPEWGSLNVIKGKAVADWIENRIVLEFQKLLVLPNMEDFVIYTPSPRVP